MSERKEALASCRVSKVKVHSGRRDKSDVWGMHLPELTKLGHLLATLQHSRLFCRMTLQLAAC